MILHKISCYYSSYDCLSSDIVTQGSNSNGYWTKYSNGLLRQRGYIKASSSTITVTCPVEFASTDYNVTITNYRSGITCWAWNNISAMKSSFFTIIYNAYNGVNVPDGFYWEAYSY